MNFDLGGFAEEPEDIDGDYESFNRLLADEYYGAFLNEDFEATGIISYSFFESFLYWLNQCNNLSVEELNLLKVGKVLTVNKRTLIDAVYEKRYGSLAEVYLDYDIYDPKLLFALIACDNEEFDGYVFLNSIKIGEDKLNELFNELYNLIEVEYVKTEDKEYFLNLIYNNFGRIRCNNEFILSQPTEFQFYKDMKQVISKGPKLKKIRK